MDAYDFDHYDEGVDEDEWDDEEVEEEEIEDDPRVRYPHAHVQLVGEDGNAFSILGRVSRALRSAGATDADVKAFQAEAMSGDYDGVLRAAMAWVTVS